MATAASSVQNAIDPNIRHRIDGYIQKEMKNQKIPGLAFAIIKNGNIVYGQGYGYSNIEHKVPVTLETVFQSGSMGKQFTAMAIMILVERGIIGLDTLINEYFEDAPREWKHITVRHLLTHTAGMTDYPDDFDYHQEYTEDDMLELIKTVSLDFKPGKNYSYSNLGYATLGILIHIVTDKFYGDFMKENIFKPLDMKTARIISEADIVMNRAAGYILEDDKVKNQEWVSPSVNTFADGALYLSVNDIVKWDRGLSSNILLKKQKSFDEMWSPVRLNDGSTYPYGFGWELDKTISDMTVVKHSGTWQGFESMIIRVLDAKITVIVFANLSEADADGIATEILKLYDSTLALKSYEEE